MCADGASSDGVGSTALVLAGVFISYITVSIGVSSLAILRSSDPVNVVVGKNEQPPMFFG